MSHFPETDPEFAAGSIFSVCLPDLVAAEFRADAERVNLPEWDWLTTLLEMSFEEAWVIKTLGNCPRPMPVNIEVRLMRETIRRLRYFSRTAEISSVVYVQRLLYHLYVTHRIYHGKEKIVDSIGIAD
jgi:hypothetical protein